MTTAAFDSHVLPNPFPIPADAPQSVEILPDEVAAPPRPTPRPRPGFWGSIGWLVVLFLAMQETGFVVGFGLAALGVPFLPAVVSALFGGQVVGAGLAVLLLRARGGKGWVKEVGLNRLPIVPALLAILCVPGLQFLAGMVSLLMQSLLGTPDPIAGVVKEVAGGLPWWLGLLAIAVGPALNEELWFRGYLGRGLVGRFGPLVGILLTSALFGVFHLNLIQGMYATVLGLALHLIYRATRSLWVPILVHFLFNSWALGVSALMAALGAGETANTANATTDGEILVILAVYGGVALTVLAGAAWGLYRMRVRTAEQFS